MPKGLSRRARQEWRILVDQLSEMDVLSSVDGIALGLLCTDIAELERVFSDLTKTGYLVRNPVSKNIRTNPLVAVVSDLHRRVTQGLREFGLTPSSRSRVETLGSDPGGSIDSQMAAFLRSRKPA